MFLFSFISQQIPKTVFHFSNKTIQRITLNGGEMVQIDGNQLNTFITIPNHFSTTSLDIDVLSFRELSNWSQKANFGQKLFFPNANLNITAKGPSSITFTIWILNYTLCGLRTIHSSGQNSARLDLPKFHYYGSTCWFLEFPVNPSASIESNPLDNKRNYSIIYPENGTINEIQINQRSLSNPKFNKLFVITAIGSGQFTEANFSFKTNRLFSDIQSKMDFFQYCKMGVNCTNDNITQLYYLKTNFEINSWIYALLSIATLLIIIIPLISFFNPEKQTGSSLETVEPLLNTAPLITNED